MVTSAGALAALDGNPTHFRLAAEAHHIRLAFQYDPHFAVSVSQVDPLPHQMDAVYTHLLTQPRIRFLIADDPGAGKTIMAGLLIKELKFRGLIERTLIITPANLTDQWRRELHDKFGETFSVVNRATINAAYGRNIWENTPQCITSVDFVARQDDILNLLRDVHFDLCIVDEAHKMAAYRYGTQVNKTQRYELGEFLREHTDHYLFLTATPPTGDPDNFALLLQLLDQDLYVTGHILAEASAQNENRMMIRRLKEDMKKFDGSPCFPPRHVQTLPYQLSPQELTLYNAVTAYVQHNFQRAEAAENRNVGLALTVLQRRLASSVAAVRLSLERRRKRLTDLQKLGRLRQEYDELPEDFDDLTEAERWQFEDDLVERLTMAENMAELEAEIEDLERLVQLARHTERTVAETKFEELRQVLSQHISGRNERLLIFTEHKDTLDFLIDKLTNLLLRKLDDMRIALGSDRVYDVIGEIIPAPRFDALMKDWLARRRTMTEILAEIDIQTDAEQVARIRADMHNMALGSRYIDMSKLIADVQQSKENRLMPEYIERFFLEAYRSFGGTITPVKGSKGVWSISRIPPDLRKLPEPLERKYGKIGMQYPQLTFDKDQVVGYFDLEFVGPGHPLFEGIVERVLREYGPSLRQGACFYNADATAPTVLWLLKCGVEDGQGRMVGERLFAIHKTGAMYRKNQPYALLDLKTPEGGVDVTADVRQAATEEDQVIDWSLDAVTPSYFEEIEAHRKNEVSIKEKYVRKSLQFLIGESIKKLAQYDAQLRQMRDENDPRRLNIQGNRAREDARRHELSQRLKDRLAEIEQEGHLSEKPPEVLGVAVILPAPQEVVASVEGMESDPEVEKIAIEVVMQYAQDQGHKPVSVEEENCGWDITSLHGGQVARYIEVKGRASAGGVALTPNEWIKAQRFGTDYWLYVVVYCKTNPQLYLIQDPASKLHPKEEVSVVRYMVGQGDWQQAADRP
ncbi:MAG TPA: DUF3883 domain-containing protein [Candidatus Tectomicrobia bacterium]